MRRQPIAVLFAIAGMVVVALSLVDLRAAVALVGVVLAAYGLLGVEVEA